MRKPRDHPRWRGCARKACATSASSPPTLPSDEKLRFAAVLITDLGVLPLVVPQGHPLRARRVKFQELIALLAGALLLVGLRLVDVEVAFFGAAVLTVLLRQINVKEAYAAIEWPVVVTLACLIAASAGIEGDRRDRSRRRGPDARRGAELRRRRVPRS